MGTHDGDPVIPVITHPTSALAENRDVRARAVMSPRGPRREMGSGAGTVIGHRATPPRDVIYYFNYVTRLPLPTPLRQLRVGGGGRVIRAAAAPDVREKVQMFPGWQKH